MTEKLGTEARPLRVAVVGSGPSGFYAADALLSAKPTVEVDVFEELPAPFGLVRYGVAPDHAKIKSIIKVYERTAKNANFGFLGNVAVGRDVQVEELRAFYDAIIFASGAQTDRRLGIPGEDLPGSYTATEFVAWYNGHPDYQDREFDLSHDVAMIIGQGNVAIDVCRILAKTVDELKDTDITARSLEVLAGSKVKEVHMVGRRGPAQAAFTTVEIKEFGKLEDCDPVVSTADLDVSPTSQIELDDTKNRTPGKNYEVLKEFAQRTGSGKSKRFVIHFHRSPVDLLGNGKVERVVLEHNRLEGEPGKQKSVGTGNTDELPCGAFFRSVGYRGVPIDGVPFHDRWGIIPNVEGRITDGDAPVPGLYAVGWIKRGPSGVIGTNKPDSIETVKHLVSDIPRLQPCATADRRAVLDLLAGRGVAVVQWADWKKIDAAEVERGRAAGKPREKFLTAEEMLRAAGLA